jgi:hypothetical protein
MQTKIVANPRGKHKESTKMHKILAIIIMFGLLGPVPSTMAQEGMLRASAESWKRQQARQDKTNREFKRLEQEAARSCPTSQPADRAKSRTGNGSVR